MKSTQVLSLWRKPVAGLALTILIAFTILSSGVAGKRISGSQSPNPTRTLPKFNKQNFNFRFFYFSSSGVVRRYYTKMLKIYLQKAS